VNNQSINLDESEMLNISTDFKEQMVEARRNQILMGAAQVFAEKGFHKATTKEIAKVAGVSEGTIYNYFDNKRELLLAMIDLIGIQSLKEIVIDAPPDDPKTLLTMIMRDRYQLLQEYGHLMAPIIAEIFTDANLREAVYRRIVMPFITHLEQYIQAHINSAEFRQIDPMIVPRAFIGATIINFTIKLSGIDPRYDDLSIETLIEQIVSLFLDGLLQSNEL
jgi:AcrR family transcriptional regulator